MTLTLTGFEPGIWTLPSAGFEPGIWTLTSAGFEPGIWTLTSAGFEPSRLDLEIFDRLDLEIFRERTADRSWYLESRNPGILKS
jgi:hypothetical protein